MPDTHNNQTGTQTLGQQGKEERKGILRIISIWRKFAEDPEPSIRALTLATTVIAFLVLTTLPIYPILSSEVHKHIIVIALVVCVVLLIVVVLWVSLRLTSRAPTEVLATGFANISRQRYPAT